MPEPPKGGGVEQPKVMSDSELLSTIKTVAILPFVDLSSGHANTLNHGDLKRFAEKFANHLVASNTFKGVLYPQQALMKLIDTPFSVQRKDDLKEIGNLLNVDAILYGVVNQYKMYYPPQLSLSMKFYVTRLDRFARSEEISSLAHSGVPLFHYNPTFFRQLWDTSAYYDGSNQGVQKKIKHYLKTHETEFYGFTSDRVLRTKDDFFNFIAYDLSNSLDTAKKVEEYMSPKPGKSKKSFKNRPHHLPSGYYHR